MLHDPTSYLLYTAKPLQALGFGSFMLHREIFNMYDEDGSGELDKEV
jgi:hypothetical protein